MGSDAYYKVTITDLAYAFGMIWVPLRNNGVNDVFFLHHPYYPNQTIKKIAVKFSNDKGTGFEVFPYDKNLDYTNPNFKGESSEILRNASITNLGSIKEDVIKMKECSILKHKKEHS